MNAVTAPLMKMGLVGFPDQQYFIGLLANWSQAIRWEHAPVTEADALWVNGERALPSRGQIVRIPSGQPDKPSVSLDLGDLDRPVAFALPCSPLIVPPRTFDPQSAASVAGILRIFEVELQRSAVELALGAEIARRRHEWKSPVLHLRLHGKLVGVVNVHGRIGIAPRLSAAELAASEWVSATAAERAIPTGFVKMTMPQVMWRYIGRSHDDLLPARYRKSKIYYRHMPSVPARMIKDAHLAVIAELTGMPQSLEYLALGTGLPDAQLSQVLAALYFAGAITTDASRAGALHTGARASEGPPSDIMSEGFPESDSAAPGDGARTVHLPLI